MKAWLFVSVFVFNYFEKGCRKKSARDNPERDCGGFWVHCSSKKPERMARETMDICLWVQKESNKTRFDSYRSGTVYWSYPILPFGIVACTFFPTTFLEIAVYFKRLRTTRARVKIGTREEGFLPTLRVSPAIFTHAGVFRSLFYQPSLSIKIVSKLMKMSNKTVY